MEISADKNMPQEQPKWHGTTQFGHIGCLCVTLLQTEGGKMQLANNYLNPEILQSLHDSSIEEAGIDMLMLSDQTKYS